ncbi:PRC-barrel domain-containing protein [Roseivivax sediminis]|uniref:PRC-barrel domain-containing protein n=1 Tax=Roseivivax sediminis TaxID=936889 RepID=A0A1I1W375_9RHOB|nr:PRC-barrel domain-containing protein [Roseivivax sediminis]SFD89612.1 PRC-barrel domain-containing protein [Roseivivax sediminis]
MFRTSLAALVAAALALPAAAQDTGSDTQTDEPAAQADAQTDPQAGAEPDQAPYITATMIQEARIVSLEGDYDAETWEGDQPLQPIMAGLSEIGSVEEILLDDAGMVQGITTDIGGFLGIGEKTVMIPLSDLRLARSPEDETITIVTRLNEQQLDDAPEFEDADD